MEVAVRTFLASLTVALVFLLPSTGSPQILQPSGVPLVYQGGLYYPSGPTVFFDGALMVRVGTFQGVPIYLNPSSDPVNVVLVPVGGKLMRPYERTQADIQADLLVPDPPEFPDQPEWIAREPYFKHLDPRLGHRFAPPFLPPSGAAIAPAEPLRRGPASRGVWITFNGRMWTPTGPGSELTPRLRVIGSYFDFPVYQDPARRDRIFVPATAGGSLIQYDVRPQ
jgi:hypothetical protein